MDAGGPAQENPSPLPLLTRRRDTAVTGADPMSPAGVVELRGQPDERPRLRAGLTGAYRVLREQKRKPSTTVASDAGPSEFLQLSPWGCDSLTGVSIFGP